MYRLIYRLLITFGRKPTQAICVNLDRDGNNLLKSGAGSVVTMVRLEGE